MTEFIAKNADNEEVQLKFIEVDADILFEANKVYNKTFANLLSSGGLLRKKLTQELRDQGLWDDKKQKELESLNKEIVEKEHKLHQGGMKLSDAKNLALSIKELRNKQTVLLSSYTEYDNNTIEGQADNAYFNYLVYACTVYSNDGKPYFDSYESFTSYRDPVALVAASEYAKKHYGLDDNSFLSSLPENQFLKKFKFVDDGLRLINTDGKLVDQDGNLIDELGRKIDEEGNVVDVYGFKRDDKGEFIDESLPFLDDDGNPIVVDSEAEPIGAGEDSA